MCWMYVMQMLFWHNKFPKVFSHVSPCIKLNLGPSSKVRDRVSFVGSSPFRDHGDPRHEHPGAEHREACLVYQVREIMYQYQCTSVPVYQCTSVPVYQCTSVPVYQCASVPVYQCTSVPVYQCTSVPVYQCTSVLVYQCNSVTVCQWTCVPVYQCTSVHSYSLHPSCFMQTLYWRVFIVVQMYTPALTYADSRYVVHANQIGLLGLISVCR